MAIAAAPGKSSAIVSSDGGPARVYLVGAAITDTATLEAVFSDHVVLRVDGNPETLSFPQAGARCRCEATAVHVNGQQVGDIELDREVSMGRRPPVPEFVSCGGGDASGLSVPLT